MHGVRTSVVHLSSHQSHMADLSTTHPCIYESVHNYSLCFSLEMTLIRYSALAFPQLGLVDTAPNQKKWQKGYCYVHRIIVGTLLVFTCAIQILVCFRRDGFVGNLSRSNKSETICTVEQHLIISHVMQDSLLIAAYVLLVWYYTKWQPKQNYLVSSHLSWIVLFCSLKNSSY